MNTMPLARGNASAGLAADLRRAEALISAAETVDELVGSLRSVARRLIGADGVAIVLREGDTCHYVEEDAIGRLWKGGRFPMSDCVSGWTMLRRRTAIIPDILEDDRVPQAAYRGTFVRSMAMAPMGREQARGAIGAYWAHVFRPSAAEIDTLERLAAAAGAALERIAAADPDSLAPVKSPRRPPLAARLQQLTRRWVKRAVPRKTLPPVRAHLTAVALVVLCIVGRLSLIPALGSIGVYMVFFPAIVLSAVWGGRGAATTALVLGALGAAAIETVVEGGAEPFELALGTLLFLAAGGLVAVVSSSVRDALDRQTARQSTLEQRDEQLARISRELDHRSRNTLAVVSALTRHAAQSCRTPAEMYERLSGHFSAMSLAQGHLMKLSADGVPVRDLVRSSLEVFISDGRLTFEIDLALLAPAGCEIMLCLAFHELATNSCKYGALAESNGEVTLRARSEGDRVSLVWSESGGTKVAPPDRRSTGTRLIEGALARAPEGRVEMAYLPAGLVCTMSWRQGRRAAA